MKIRTRNQSQETDASGSQGKENHPKQRRFNNIKNKPTRQHSSKTKKHAPAKLKSLNPDQEVYGYQGQIKRYILKKEESGMNKIDHQYLSKCQRFNKKMRGFLIKHFMKIGKAFKLKRLTIALAVFYLDRYLQRKVDAVNNQNLIKYTLASILIAMKYEEIYPPEMYEWAKQCRHEDIIVAEAELLQILNFNLIYESVEYYIDIFSKDLKLTDKQKQMIHFLVDLSLFDAQMYQFKPSVLACSIIDSVVNPGKMNERKELSVKWMVERNSDFALWLKESRYPQLK